MAKIIEFSRFKSKSDGMMSRTEALVKGKIDIYKCNSCGEDFEVINEEFPECCPVCGIEILQWNTEDVK